MSKSKIHSQKRFAFTFLGVLAFSCLFLFFKKALVNIVPKHFLTITSFNLVASIHSILMVTSSIIYLKGMFSFDNWRKISYITVGYLVYDLLNSNYNYYIAEPLFNMTLSYIVIRYLHHLLVIRLLLLPINNYKKIAPKTFLYEISTPFLNIVLFYSNQQGTLLYKVCFICLLFTYFVFRVINFSIVFIRDVVNNSLIPSSAKAFYLLFIIMNYYWFFGLCQIFYKKFLS